MRAHLLAALFLFGAGAQALTVNEVAKDLACPCECPLILEDCNMTCGLEWKNQVGEFIKQGMSKQQIIDYFVGKYGDAARITPAQRINGKIYQYTRSFDDLDWALLWGALAVWAGLMFAGVYVGVRKVFFDRPQDASVGGQEVKS
ncbi:MAG: cytochrome c-type biogenesis protein CcmH [Betaproteobacteria bacterium]|nr:cytochrome c-type biogenesis protein CcmH [Betaproteobacteria bacterium]